MPTGERGSDILRVVMAGSVDDGKSTLIGRLLYDAQALLDDQVAGLRRSGPDPAAALDFSLATDGLRAEREQGITIDVAYRYLSTPGRRIVLADAPGHEQYTRNMATAASRADVAVLLIDAVAGLTRQSKRHAFICAAFGVSSYIVAVNKMDLVGFAQGRFDEIAEGYRDLAARLGLAEVRIVPVCALSGENVVKTAGRMPWYDGPSILSCLDTIQSAQRGARLDLRLVIQGVRPAGARRAYAGRIVSGVLRPGDDLVVLPGGVQTRVETLAVGAAVLPAGTAGRSVTVTLADAVDAGPGSVLVRPDAIPPQRHETDTMVVWAGKEPLVAGAAYEFKHVTGWVKGRCTSVALRADPETLCRTEAGRLVQNDVGWARFALETPILTDSYRLNRAFGSLVVVSPETCDTLGAAMIVDSIDSDLGASAPSGTRPDRTGPSPAAPVTPRERASLMRQTPVTVWLTGLSGAGKSTIANALERRLVDSGRAAFVLDGDSLRLGLNRDLGFSPRDRAENIRRVAEVARLMTDAGVIVIAALISPYRKDRASAREIVGPDRFLEVHVSTPIEVCEQRDPKGMYRRARANQISAFTGITAPYEPPEQPDLVLDTQHLSVEACVERLVRQVEARAGAPATTVIPG